MSKTTFATHFMGGLSLLALAASFASGQSTISGVVKDSTGAVIANATVEASSDVLIEKTRTVTTDSLGRYAIIDLRPGTYVVTIRWGFTFSTSFYSNRYGEGVATGGTVDNGYLSRTWTVTAASTYPKNCVGCTPGAPVFPAGTVLGQGPEVVQLVAPGKVLAPRLNQLDFSLKKRFTFGERFVIEPEAQVFNVLNSNAAVIEAVSLGGDTLPFLPKSSRTSSSPANCGLGGTVNTITNPRLLRLAVLFRF